MKNLKTLLIASSLAGFAFSSNASSVVAVTDVFAHNQGNNFSGDIGDMTNGTGMSDGVNDYSGLPQPWPDADESGLDPNWPTSAAHPSNWTATGGSYWHEFSARALLDSSTSDNAKIGWIIFDLGESVDQLDEFYIWNTKNQTNEFVVDYNIYHATAPTVAPTSGPTSGALDYVFNTTTGGWTEIATPDAMTNRNSVGFTSGEVNVVHDLGGVTARYIGIEILSNTGDINNTGLAEIAITAVPEPSTLALIGLAAMALFIRRRR